MTHKLVKIDFVYAHVRFASHMRETMAVNRYTVEEIAVVSGYSSSSVKDMMSGAHPNPHMLTFLGICNALDLNPIDYFDLME